MKRSRRVQAAINATLLVVGSAGMAVAIAFPAQADPGGVPNGGAGQGQGQGQGGGQSQGQGGGQTLIWVCKYAGNPNDGYFLKPGKQPVRVAVPSSEGPEPGDWFNDRHESSLVVEGEDSDCSPDGPGGGANPDEVTAVDADETAPTCSAASYWTVPSTKGVQYKFNGTNVAHGAKLTTSGTLTAVPVSDSYELSDEAFSQAITIKPAKTNCSDELDYAIAKTGPVEVDEGESGRYTLTVTRVAGTGGSGTVTDTLPTGVQAVASTVPQACSLAHPVITCNVSGPTTIRFTARFTQAGTVTNTAVVEVEGDDNPDNDSASWDTVVVAPGVLPENPEPQNPGPQNPGPQQPGPQQPGPQSPPPGVGGLPNTAVNPPAAAGVSIPKTLPFTGPATERLLGASVAALCFGALLVLMGRRPEFD